MVALTRNAKIVTLLLICAVVTVGSLLLTMNGGSHHLRGGVSGDNNANSSSENSESDWQSPEVASADNNIEEEEEKLETVDKEEPVDEPVEIVEDEPVVDEPVVDEPVADEPVADEPKEVKLNPTGPWPECLGIHSDKCVNIVTHHTSGDVQIAIIEPDLFVTTDWVSDRVRIYVDEDYFVSEVPKRG
eukprot:CAMPEP_0196815506 /NCGR_PEP_ID=MMETSP1362-20130617/50193_1 /TAXON_ID=163516 /ORGANISM="Leptocylindrus danicus, Strain CCMP1856" /LENGTH=187 /DNA_ID=CAMNT_0042192493 /DNA_START=83 /DNA_END=646 /DNA_ORIENTATION=+